jgi:putative hydrolase of the HAD superfamily
VLTGRDLDVVTLDALGTVVRLDDPTPRLRASLRARLGLDVPLDRCGSAMRAEMRHYRAGAPRADDAAAHARLRLECADVLADGLGVGLTGADVLPSLTDAIAYSLYPDVVDTLDRLERAGLRLAVVSNWDVSLHDTLRSLGLAHRFEAVLTSAETGAAKPAPALYRHALDHLDARPHRVLHVGDDAAGDVDAARAAGLHAVLLQRDDRRALRRPRIATLHELPALLDLDAAGTAP